METLVSRVRATEKDARGSETTGVGRYVQALLLYGGDCWEQHALPVESARPQARRAFVEGSSGRVSLLTLPPRSSTCVTSPTHTCYRPLTTNILQHMYENTSSLPTELTLSLGRVYSMRASQSQVLCNSNYHPAHVLCVHVPPQGTANCKS